MWVGCLARRPEKSQWLTLRHTVADLHKQRILPKVRIDREERISMIDADEIAISSGITLFGAIEETILRPIDSTGHCRMDGDARIHLSKIADDEIRPLVTIIRLHSTTVVANAADCGVTIWIIDKKPILVLNALYRHDELRGYDVRQEEEVRIEQQVLHRRYMQDHNDTFG